MIAHASLLIDKDSPEALMLAYINYGCLRRFHTRMLTLRLTGYITMSGIRGFTESIGTVSANSVEFDLGSTSESTVIK